MGAGSTSLGLLHKIHIWTAARCLPMLLKNKDLRATLRLIDVKPAQFFQAVDAQQISTYITSTTKHPWFMRDRRCLRQGILAMMYLRKAGYDPVLNFGIDTTSIARENLSAHCWVDLNAVAVMNDKLENMSVIHSVPEGANT